MKTRYVFLVFLGILIISYLSNASLTENDASQQIKRKIQAKPTLRIIDEPVIKEFSIVPNFWIRGQSGNIRVNWQVEPISGGSHITQITITKGGGSGPDINYSTTTAPFAGIDMPIAQTAPAGSSTYVLSATNEANRIKTLTATLEVGTVNTLRENLLIQGVHFNPTEVPEGADPYDFLVTVVNRSDRIFQGINIYIDWILPILGARLKAEKSVTINPEAQTYTLRMEGLGTTPAGHFRISLKTAGESILSELADLEVVRTVRYYDIGLRR